MTLRFPLIVLALLFLPLSLRADAARGRAHPRKISLVKATGKSVKKVSPAEKLKREGEARERKGDIDGAIAAYEAALAKTPDDALAQKVQGMKADRSARRRKQSDDVYLRALKASQKGDDQRAHDLCRNALALDPDNIQAQRMLKRLEKRSR